MARFNEIGFIPYTFDDEGNLVFLFIKSEDEEGKETLDDFGVEKNEYEMNGYYAAIRSFTLKTEGIFLASSFSGPQPHSSFDTSSLYSAYQPCLETIFRSPSHTVIHHILSSRMYLLYPLPFYTSAENLPSDLVWTSQFSPSLDDTAYSALFSTLSTPLSTLTSNHKTPVPPPAPTHAILHTDPRSHWRHQYAGMYIPSLIENGQIWKVYHCYDDEFPSETDLEAFKAILIPGNEDNPYDDFEYLKKTKDLIKKVHCEYKNIRVFGSCAGHQMVAVALGGECEKLEIEAPMVFGKFKTKIGGDLGEKAIFKEVFGEREEICVMRSHGWIVSKLPEGAVGMGECEYGEYDIFGVDDQILTTQFHPEFTERFEEYHEIIPMYAEGLMTEKDRDEQMGNITNPALKSDGDDFLELIRLFFKGGSE